MKVNFQVIHQQFRHRFQPGKEVEALNQLCDDLGLDRRNAVFKIAPEIRNAYAIAQGRKPVEILISPEILSERVDFGLLTRILAHELLHVDQRTRRLFPIRDHNERELLAYADTLFRSDLPPIASVFVRKDFTKKGLEYYPRLSKWKQFLYRSLKIKLENYGKSLELGGN